ncbi:MAG: hypothetical protein LBJ21_05910 [Acidobacteriota bacterium]|jgi:hypothetical protein|nr:hypothetical protein [Acidobacteriota bacterium]
MKKATLVVLFSVAMLAILAAPAQSFGAPLDRAALIKLADNYFAALVAHNPKGVPLADNVKMVEQIKRIKPGEGLWKTATAVPTNFKIVIPDPVSQEVGGIVILGIGGKPAQLGFRLKVEDGKITETEHLIVEISNPDNPMLQSVRPGIPLEIPYEYRDSRGRLIWIAKSYYDALDLNNGSLSPFASDCERRENGMRTAPSGGPSLGGVSIPGSKPAPPSLYGMQDCTTQLNTGTFQYIDTIEHRRVFAADEVTGLAVGFSHFHHSMKQKKFTILNVPGREESDMSNQQPFDMPAMHIYKIWGGQIHEIEAIGIVTDYNSPTGWE